MAFDDATGKMLLFGGAGVTNGESIGTPLSDTWTWNGTSWSPAAQSLQPLPRRSASVAYDPVHRNVIMQGGLGEVGMLNETWTWDGARWVQMSPDHTPPSFIVANEPMVTDVQRGLVLLFAFTRSVSCPGCIVDSFDIPHLNQTWAWNGSNWSMVATSGSPSGHELHPAGLAFDAARNSTVLFGHVGDTPTTWTLKGTAWSKASLTGPTAIYFSLAADDARADLVLFGQSGDTWTWNGVRWEIHNPAHSPSPRIGASMAYDPIHHVVVLFGGFTPVSVLQDTWTWDGSDWTKVA
jgi:hypothetical protein